MIRYAKLSLPFDLNALKTELHNTFEKWEPHFNILHYEGAWTALALRSPGGEHKNIIPELTTHADYSDTVYMLQFPSVKELLSQINCPIMAVRLLNLQAGAVIKPHKDNELAFEKGEARLHFPVITNSDVEFYIEEERIYMQEGDCWYINANLTHNVSNTSGTDRIHLVIDCKVNEWLKALIISSSQMSFKEDYAANELSMMIHELRLQNTETSNKIALDLEQQLDQK